MHSLIPAKYSLERMRAALLFFAAILIPLSFPMSAWAPRRIQATDRLTHTGIFAYSSRACGAALGAVQFLHG
jgi:hypothetical protein